MLAADTLPRPRNSTSEIGFDNHDPPGRGAVLDRAAYLIDIDTSRGEIHISAFTRRGSKEVLGSAPLRRRSNEQTQTRATAALIGNG
jgi:hypothetical protein